MSTRSKCDRAIVAYLQAEGVADNIYPANYSGKRVAPCVTVLSHSGRPEVSMTGNYRFQVRIRVEGDSVVQPVATPAGQQPLPVNLDAQRVALDAIVVAVHDAMMQSDNDEDLKATRQAINAAGRALAVAVDGTAPAKQKADNNADMKDFTMTGLYDAGLDGGNPRNSEGAADSSFWAEDILFQAVACGANVD
jgi:hypothetical protein